MSSAMHHPPSGCHAMTSTPPSRWHVIAGPHPDPPGPSGARRAPRGVPGPGRPVRENSGNSGFRPGPPGSPPGAPRDPPGAPWEPPDGPHGGSRDVQNGFRWATFGGPGGGSPLGVPRGPPGGPGCAHFFGYLITLPVGTKWDKIWDKIRTPRDTPFGPYPGQDGGGRGHWPWDEVGSAIMGSSAKGRVRCDGSPRASTARGGSIHPEGRALGKRKMRQHRAGRTGCGASDVEPRVGEIVDAECPTVRP